MPPGDTRERRSIVLPTVFMVIFLGVTTYVFFTSDTIDPNNRPTISGTGWWWVALALVMTWLSFVCAAMVMHALSPVPLRFSTMVLGQVAAAASKVVAPAASGVVGLNVRLLVKNGSGLPSALTTVAATQVAQLGLTAVLMVFLAPMAGWIPKISAPDTEKIWIVVAVAVALIGALFIAYQTRGGARLSLRENFREGIIPLRKALTSPTRTLMIVGGSLGLTGTLAVAMWACLHSLGGQTSLLTASLVLMVGAALGAFVPTPGGVGGVEAAMTSLLLAAGHPAWLAMPAVLLFRVITFWTPAPIGAVAAVWLRRHDHL